MAAILQPPPEIPAARTPLTPSTVPTAPTILALQGSSVSTKEAPKHVYPDSQTDLLLFDLSPLYLCPLGPQPTPDPQAALPGSWEVWCRGQEVDRDKVLNPALPLRAFGIPDEDGNVLLQYWPFSASDLYNWKTHNPSFSKDAWGIKEEMTQSQKATDG